MAGMLQPGVLTLAATPIGNPLDASVRLMRALADADLIAAEDTRRLQRLLRDLDVEAGAKIISCHEHNEVERIPWLLEALAAGQKVLLVTDAGMPVVSDPGYRAVQAAVAAGRRVEVIPGPSAVLTALAVSGLAPDRFSFEGFVPRGPGQRESLFAQLREARRTLVFFESPRRTASALAAMRDGFGPARPAVLARELTKTHEEVVRGTLAELAKRAATTEVLGEIAIVVAGADAVAADPAELAAEVVRRAEAGERLKDAAKEVARGHSGISARDLYEMARTQRG